MRESPINKDDLQEVWKDMGALDHNMDKLYVRAQEHVKKKHSNVAELSEMIESVDFTTKCLEHEDSATRLAALDVLGMFHHDFDATHLFPRFELMAFDDRDQAVRRTATQCIANAARNQGPEITNRIGRRLSTVVLDETADVEYRKSAFIALRSLSSDFDARMKNFDELRFPEDVDWRFVRSWIG